jgi:hypothetical protein
MRVLTFYVRAGEDDGATSYVMQSFMGAVNRMNVFNPGVAALRGAAKDSVWRDP